MKELLTMWKSTRMIILAAVIAAVYAAVLIPFKAIPIIPGYTEFRVAQVIPPVASLLFGPAAAWGTAMGNLIGDFFGTFGPGSFFGFIGNFFLGLVPYALWGRLGPLSSGSEPSMSGPKQVVEFVAVVLVSALATAAVIAWGLEVLRLLPFAALGTIIVLNDFIFPAIVSPVILYLLYRRVKRWGLLWTQIMPREDVSSGAGTLGTALLLVGSFGAIIVGNWVSITGGALPFAAGFQQFGNLQVVGRAGLIWAVAPFMAALALALLLARPRVDVMPR